MSEKGELAIFLRDRRESVAPADVGLPSGPRRRTPGLRRAELATLAGISVEYLVRLEQGRDRHPSARILSTLADALRLGMNDRIHLHRVTKAEKSAGCAGGTRPVRTVRPTVQALLTRLEPTPAVLLNGVNDILAHTDGYERLVSALGLLDGPAPNLARFVFTDARARAVYPEWNLVADEQVATLKQGVFRAGGHGATLADELTAEAGSAFEQRVATVAGPPRPTGSTRLVHPEVGELRLAYETLEMSDDAQRIIVYLPADDASARSVERLTEPEEILTAARDVMRTA